MYNGAPSWLERQWNDVKGNVKWWAITVIGTGLVIAAVALTHGLQLWQQVLLSICFIFLFVWALVATFARKREFGSMPATPLASSDPLTLVDAHGVVDDNPKLTYHSKIYLELRNDSGESIAVRKPRWIRVEPGDVSSHLPFGFSFLPARLWNPTGAPPSKWEGETNDNIRLHPNQHLLTWVGLDESLNKAEINSRHRARLLGTLAIGVTIAGHDIEQMIRL